MSAVWTRLTLDPVRPDFAWMLREAQHHSFPLRRVHVLSSEWYELEPGRGASKVVILAPPDLIAIWQAPAPGELDLETVAASAIMGLAECVLESAGKLTPF